MIATGDGKVYEDEVAYQLGIEQLPETNDKGVSEIKVKPKLDWGTATEGYPRLKLLADMAGTDTGNLVKGVLESAYKAVTLPGRVMKGEADPYDIEEAFNFAGNVVMTPAPLVNKMVDGTLGSFAGVKSKTVNKEKLYEAQNMFIKGEHMDEIWGATGWFKGVDGKWRYEIPDATNIKFNDDAFELNIPKRVEIGGPDGWAAVEGNPQTLATLKKETPITEVLDHPELFEAYPHLKEMKLVPYTPEEMEKFSTSWAFYQEHTNSIHFNKNLPKEEIVPIILHEMQHGIQKTENFAKGGGPAKDFVLNYDKTLEPMKKELENYWQRHQSGEKLVGKDLDRVTELAKIFDVDKRRRQAAVEKAYENYRRLAGEVESRLVEQRYWHDILGNYDYKTFPLSDMDTPFNKQTVKWNPVAATPYGYGDPMSPPIPMSAKPTQMRSAANDNIKKDTSVADNYAKYKEQEQKLWDNIQNAKATEGELGWARHQKALKEWTEFTGGEFTPTPYPKPYKHTDSPETTAWIEKTKREAAELKEKYPNQSILQEFLSWFK